MTIHPQLLHGSAPNRSSKKRDVLIVQLAVSGARFHHQEMLELGTLHARNSFIRL